MAVYSIYIANLAIKTIGMVALSVCEDYHVCW